MLFTDKCQNFATDRILETAFYIDTERGNYMKTIVVCDDVEIERLLLKEILCQYFEEINEEVSIVEYDSGETLIADVEEGYIAMDLLFLDHMMTEYMYMKKITAGIGRDLLYFHIPKQKSQLFLCFQGREYFKKCLDCSCYFSQLISS